MAAPNPMDGKKWDGATWVTLGPVSGTSFTGSNLTSLSDFTAYNSAPTAVTLASFEAAQAADDAAIVVTWETATELNNRGFNLWRGTSSAGPDIKLNDLLIPSDRRASPAAPVHLGGQPRPGPGHDLLLLARGSGHQRQRSRCTPSRSA